MNLPQKCCVRNFGSFVSRQFFPPNFSRSIFPPFIPAQICRHFFPPNFSRSHLPGGLVDDEAELQGGSCS
jgi:hypothetical protein